MTPLVHHLITASATRVPTRPALKYKDEVLSYDALHQAVQSFASGAIGLGLKRAERVAIYAEKRFETVIAMFGAAAAGGVYVPVNPLLKAEQVSYILADCDVRILVTTADRLPALAPALANCRALETIVVAGGAIPALELPKHVTTIAWDDVLASKPRPHHRIIDSDMAAILYTSGSTGKPKGVVLSHRNITAGAESVAEYLSLTENDRVLSVLPLSFDYGMNQLTTMFLVGGSCVLMNFLFPRDIITLAEKEKITGLACVPPLWIQLSQLPWPESVTTHLRYITNSGGHMPRTTLDLLRKALPQTTPFLMYGLTEAFRSTYLPPADIDAKPDSMGKAIPNAEILVVRPDGTECAADEPGELVHRGVLVAMGYWNDPEKTAIRFKPAPGQDKALPITELAVWSGDMVKRDADGYLYFVTRNDEMIKTTGYRVSPTEIEEIVYATGLVSEAIAFGIPHPVLGQAVGVVASAAEGKTLDAATLKAEMAKRCPSYMVPSHIDILSSALPRNANGKIDRKLLATERQGIFAESKT